MIPFDRLDRKTDWLLLAGILAIPYRPAIAVALLLAGTLTGRFLEKRPPFFRYRQNYGFWALISFYLVHVAGMLYSENLSFGSLDLQIKASFILIPLTALFIGQPLAGQDSMGRYWIYSALLAGSTCLLHALPDFLTDPKIANITYAEFCFFSHPTYFSLFLSIALFICMDRSFDSENHRLSWGIHGIAFLLFFFILLSQSRTGIAVAFLMLMTGVIIPQNVEFKKRARILIPVLLALIVYSALSFYSGDDRMNTLVQELAVKKESLNIDTSTYSASGTRLRIWKSAAVAASENLPWGTGTGDVRNILLEKYQNNGFSDLYLKKYNSHNQFLQTSLALGILGLLSLLAVLLVPMYRFYRNGPLFGFLAVTAFALNAFTESLFEVQSGVIVYVCFLFLFLNNSSSKLP